MRYTLELPDDLLADARRLSAISTNRAVAQTALEEFVRHLRIERLRARLGCGSFGLAQEDLARMRGGD